MNIEISYSNNTKIANEIRKYDNLTGYVNVVDVGRDRGKLESQYVITENLTCFDCDVADAIYTIRKNGYETFTPGVVLRVMSGDNKQTITKDHKKKEIIYSIEKMRQTEITIKCTDEMRARGQKSNDEEFILTGKFLQICELDKGEKHQIDWINKSMPLYKYAEFNSQMITFPMYLLTYQSSIKGQKISNTKENILIKRYLIRRIEIMRNQNNRLNIKNISYDRKSHKTGNTVGMFADIGIRETDYKSKDSWKHKRHSIHKTVTKILECYKTIDYIEDYKVNTDTRGRILGVQILGKINDPWELENKTCSN